MCRAASSTAPVRSSERPHPLADDEVLYYSWHDGVGTARPMKLTRFSARFGERFGEEQGWCGYCRDWHDMRLFSAEQLRESRGTRYCIKMSSATARDAVRHSVVPSVAACVQLWRRKKLSSSGMHAIAGKNGDGERAEVPWMDRWNSDDAAREERRAGTSLPLTKQRLYWINEVRASWPPPAPRATPRQQSPACLYR